MHVCVELQDKKKRWVWRAEEDLKGVGSFESRGQQEGTEGVDTIRAKATAAPVVKKRERERERGRGGTAEMMKGNSRVTQGEKAKMLKTGKPCRGKQRNVDDSRGGGGEEAGEDEWRLSTAEKQTRGRRQRATDCDQQRVPAATGTHTHRDVLAHTQTRARIHTHTESPLKPSWPQNLSNDCCQTQICTTMMAPNLATSQ